MTAIISAAVIFVVFAVGDMISAKTKAIVSMLLVASVVFLAGFWTGIFPTTMFADSTLLSMAGLLVTMLLVHLGTTIKLRDFGAQWRTVIISAVACIEDDGEASAVGCGGWGLVCCQGKGDEQCAYKYNNV